MFGGRRGDAADDVTLSRFARSTSFKKASMRRSQRRTARKKAVVTNRGIYYVEEDSGSPCDENLDPAGVTSSGVDGTATLGSQSTQSQGTISYTDWIQISDDDTLDKSTCGDRKKSSSSRNFSLEGKSVPFDSPLPGGGKQQQQQRAASPVLRRWSGEKNTPCTPCSDEPPVVSTFGSSCTSGVHSMEKPLGGEGGRGGARRRAPTVVATRDQLRRSLRRISGRRAKKAARRLADAADTPPPSVMDQEFYRRFAKLPLVLSGGDDCSASAAAAAADTPSPTRTPFAFSRQNPITRWLEESEELQRRTAVPEPERPLWSELVTRPPRPPASSSADERPGRKASKAKSRSSRSRTPSRKSLRRKLKQARARAELDDTVVSATAGSVSSVMPVSAV